MTTPAALSAAAIGLGLALVGIWVARPRVSVLEQRLEAMLAVDSPAAAPRRGLDAVAAALARLLGRVLGGADHVRSRMERAGLVPDVDTFRTSQALWAMTGFAGAACIVLVTGNSTRGPLSASALVLLAAGFGVVLRDQQLTRLAERREARMIVEFPAIADMLALAVAAGQGPLGALEHVTTLCRGPLAEELRTALEQARAGTPLSDALAGVARRTSVVSVARFVEGVIVALERGTPLAGVLRAQAQDARESVRTELVEKAGRKEVVMMAPVVFLVLPVTVLFAVYPGLAALDLTL